MKRIRTILGCLVFTTTLLVGGALAGQSEPTPQPPDPNQHSKISKPVASGSKTTRGTVSHGLTWFEVVEIMLSSLGLI